MLKRRGIIEWKCNACTKPIAVSSRDPTLASDGGNNTVISMEQTLPVGKQNLTLSYRKMPYGMRSKSGLTASEAELSLDINL